MHRAERRRKLASGSQAQREARVALWPSFITFDAFESPPTFNFFAVPRTVARVATVFHRPSDVNLFWPHLKFPPCDNSYFREKRAWPTPVAFKTNRVQRNAMQRNAGRVTLVKLFSHLANPAYDRDA